jgi:hypothetical protein
MAPLCGRDVVHVFEGAARAAYGVCRVAAEAAVGAPDMASAPATATAPTASRQSFIISHCPFHQAEESTTEKTGKSL